MDAYGVAGATIDNAMFAFLPSPPIPMVRASPENDCAEAAVATVSIDRPTTTYTMGFIVTDTLQAATLEERAIERQTGSVSVQHADDGRRVLACAAPLLQSVQDVRRCGTGRQLDPESARQVEDDVNVFVMEA